MRPLGTWDVGLYYVDDAVMSLQPGRLHYCAQPAWLHEAQRPVVRPRYFWLSDLPTPEPYNLRLLQHPPHMPQPLLCRRKNHGRHKHCHCCTNQRGLQQQLAPVQQQAQRNQCDWFRHPLHWRFCCPTYAVTTFFEGPHVAVRDLCWGALQMLSNQNDPACIEEASCRKMIECICQLLLCHLLRAHELLI